MDTKIKSLAYSELKLKFGHFILFDRPKWPFLPLRSIQGVWKWSQWISHAQNLWDRHQNQVWHVQNQSYKFGHFISFWLAKMATNSHFGHSGHVIFIKAAIPYSYTCKFPSSCSPSCSQLKSIRPMAEQFCGDVISPLQTRSSDYTLQTAAY